MKTMFLFFWFIVLMMPCCYANNQRIIFPGTCTKGQSIVIAAVGDILLHMTLQEKASQKGIDSLWQEAIPFIQQADIAYANLEGPIAPGMRGANNHLIYSGFPYFNYPPALALALKKTGFDIVSTANNHALDRSSAGVDKTIKTLDQAGLHYVGTRARGSHQPWFRLLTKKGINIAWIACTANTNGNADPYHQILYCYQKNDRQVILDMINHLKHTVDAIIVLPHWGEEYQTHPTAEQTVFAHQVLEAGATAVIGSHPHVLQPLKKYLTKDGRSTLILYSLGNFVSYQGKSITRRTIILLLGLTKTSRGTIINGVRFVPMMMQNRSGINNIHLTRLPTSSRDHSYDKIISHVMPMENALYAPPLITNPDCGGRDGS